MTEIMPVPRNLNFTVLPAEPLTGVFLFGAGILLCKIVCLRAGSGTRKGCRLHTITASSGEGMPGGERIQVTMVFEKII